MDHSRLNTRLTTIEETQQDIRNTLHQHSQWQAEMGGTITKSAATERELELLVLESQHRPAVLNVYSNT